MTNVFCTLPAADAYRYPCCGGLAAPVVVSSAADLVNIQSAADLAAARAALITYVWGAGGYPVAVPAETLGVVEARLAGLPNVGTADLLTFTMPAEFQPCDSYAWRLNPSTGANGRALIYHGGHSQDVDSGYTHLPVAAALREGYTVIAMVLPMYGDNTSAWYAGTEYTTHTDFGTAVEPDRATIGFSTLRIFFDPVVHVLNMLEADGFTEIAMCGLSGGGSVTTVAAALDERIRYSAPVAGTLPWFCRTAAADWGDWEQYNAALLDVANYEDMYVMACSGGRRQLQVLGWYDTAVFQASHLADYSAAIRQTAAAITSGSWAGIGDRTYLDHEVSPAAMATILAECDAYFDNATAKAAAIAAGRRAATVTASASQPVGA